MTFQLFFSNIILLFSKEKGHLATVELLVSLGVGATKGLATAVIHGHLDIVVFLLRIGADADLKYVLQHFALFVTKYCRPTHSLNPLRTAVRNNQKDIAKALISHGANVLFCLLVSTGINMNL